MIKCVLLLVLTQYINYSPDFLCGQDPFLMGYCNKAQVLQDDPSYCIFNAGQDYHNLWNGFHKKHEFKSSITHPLSESLGHVRWKWLIWQTILKLSHCILFEGFCWKNYHLKWLYQIWLYQFSFIYFYGKCESFNFLYFCRVVIISNSYFVFL